MSTTQERDFLEKVLRGNTHAINFILMLFSLSQVMDDLVDKDKPVDDLNIIRSYHMALVAIPNNQFYRANVDQLHPMLAIILQCYADSVQLEKGNAHDLHLAFVLRDRLTDLVTQCVRLLYGWDEAQYVATDIQCFFQQESLSDFMDERLMVEVNKDPQVSSKSRNECHK
ncbi:MAG: hypothetical protein ACKVJE_17490, partial [Pseudomonadales bacterium]